MRIKDILTYLKEEGEEDLPTLADAKNGEVDFEDQQNLPDITNDNNDNAGFDEKAYRKVSNLPYLKNYEHDPDSPINPINILKLSKAEMVELSNQQKVILAKYKAQKSSTEGGQYKDRGYQRMIDLLNFIKAASAAKK
jgi:hypothetical protein